MRAARLIKLNSFIRTIFERSEKQVWHFFDKKGSSGAEILTTTKRGEEVLRAWLLMGVGVLQTG